MRIIPEYRIGITSALVFLGIPFCALVAQKGGVSSVRDNARNPAVGAPSWTQNSTPAAVGMPVEFMMDGHGQVMAVRSIYPGSVQVVLGKKTVPRFPRVDTVALRR